MLEDIYILLEKRQKKDVEKFIHTYLKDFKELSDYYEYPPYSGTIEFETDNYSEMLSFILEKQNRFFYFYFDVEKHPIIKKGMLFFNTDNSVVFGISVLEDATKKYEHKLASDFNSLSVLVCNQVLPPNNVNEFKKACRVM